MIRVLTLLFIFSFQPLLARAPLEPQKMLPENIQNIMGKNEKQILSLLGEPARRDHQNLYYEIEGYRFRLIISLKDQKIHKLRYVTITGPTLDEFIDPEKKELIPISNYPDQGHNRGRFLKAEIGQWELFFHNNAER